MPAWPKVPLTTYLANSLPVIKAFDLNAFQARIVELFTTRVSDATNDPLIRYADSAGNVRSTIDHNGYLGGRTVVEIENWSSPIKADLTRFTTVGTNRSTTNPKWNIIITNSGTSGAGVIVVPPGPGITSRTVELIAGSDATTDSVDLYMDPFVINSSFLSATIEYEATLYNAVSEFAHGLTAVAPYVAASPANRALFVRSSTGAYSVLSGDGTADTAVVTSTTPTLTTAYRFRIELHGSASPYGAVVRFFINEVLTAVSTHVPNTSDPLMLYFRAKSHAASGGNVILAVSAVRVTYNRFLSAPDL